MFWKLCKFEFRSNCRTYLLMYTVLLACSIVLSFGNIESIWKMSFMSMAMGLIMIVYVGTIMAVWILCLVNIVRGYYTSMYKRESYLTHTLPFPTWQLLSVKLLFSILWLTLTTIVVFISVMLMLINLSGVGLDLIFDRVFSLEWQSIDLGYLITYLTQLLVEVCQGIMLFYFVINIVHSCYIQRYRIAIAIAILVVFTWIQSYFVLMIAGMSLTAMGVAWLDTLFHLLLLVATFIGSIFLLDHKMEVE